MARGSGGRGSVADLLLLLLLLALLAGAALRLLDRSTDVGSAVSEVEIVLSIEACPTPIADCLVSKDALYDAGGTRFGTLLAVESTPARVVLEQAGTFIVGAREDAVDLRLTVLLRGTYREKLFLADGRHTIPVGKSLTLYTDRVRLDATVVGGKNA